VLLASNTTDEHMIRIKVEMGKFDRLTMDVSG